MKKTLMINGQLVVGKVVGHSKRNLGRTGNHRNIELTHLEIIDTMDIDNICIYKRGEVTKIRMERTSELSVDSLKRLSAETPSSEWDKARVKMAKRLLNAK